MKQIFILFLLICFRFISFSQNHSLDSLRNELRSVHHDTSRINTCLIIGDTYEYINFDSSLYWYNKALLISENNLKSNTELHSLFIELKAQSLKSIGVNYYYQGNYEPALRYFNLSLILFIELKNQIAIASIYSNLGAIHQEQYRYDEAVGYYMKALPIFEKYHNLKGFATCNLNLGNVFSLQKDFKKAEGKYLKSVEIFKQIKDEFSLGTCYNNLGGIYYEYVKYDLSKEYYFKGLAIKIKYNDSLSVADVYGNIGNLCLIEKKIDESYFYYKKSLDIGLKLDNISVISNAYVSLVNIMLERNKINEAIDYAEKGLEYARKENLLDQITLAYQYLSEAYEIKGDYRKSLFYKKKNISAKDSMISMERNRLVVELDSKYQNEKHQQQIVLQSAQLGKKEAEIQQQQIRLIAFIVGFFFVLVLLILAVYYYRQKRKANILLSSQNIEIQQKNEEITSQRDEIEAQRDKLSLQNNLLAEQKLAITDSIIYAKRIQDAVLPTGEDAVKILGDHFILFKPKDIVSGDFYWTTRIGVQLLVTVADCTGHGVPGAFMSMLGISFLNEIIRKKEILTASGILDELRIYVIEALKQHGVTGEQKDGIDMAFCIINLKTLELQFAGANNPCYVIASRHPELEGEATKQAHDDITIDCFAEARNDDYYLIELKPDKMPVAYFDNMRPFTNQVLKLHKDDIIYLKSDGYEDQYAWPTHKKFLAKNLKNLLITNCKLQMADQKEILNATINKWMNGQEQIDDITLMGIRI